FAEPWNSPGVFGQLLRAVGRKDAPFILRPSVIPGMLGWAVRFLRHSSPQHFDAAVRRNVALALYSLQLMQQFRAEAGIEYSASQRGILQIFRTPEARDKAFAWSERVAEFGLESRRLSLAQMMETEPALQPVQSTLLGGVHYLRDEGGDAFQFCSALDALLRTQGVEFRYGGVVDRFVVDKGRVIAAVDVEGNATPADRFVLAAGISSRKLARTAGISLPMAPVKGYSITCPRSDAVAAPKVALVDPHLHIAIVPVGAERVRVAGTAEFAGDDRAVDPVRVQSLMARLRQLFPAYADSLQPERLLPWAGLRPMCADGTPIIGPTGLQNLFLNTAHGQLGWTLAAGSGRMVADLVLGQTPALDPRLYALDRFS
ncbi:MAG TPA: FAD-dependent oxidoreductase, partial [Steroidobacteraceae bacterium]|nr:FAD-dependent oxidoreductase [Steroidobacteraceae bacterium]